MCLAWEVGGAEVQGLEDQVAATVSVELFGLLTVLCALVFCVHLQVC